jgi:hypothetical protein
VALSLDISPGTVKIHRKNIYRKLKVSSQAELFAAFMGTRHAGRRLFPKGYSCAPENIPQSRGPTRLAWRKAMTKTWYSDLPKFYQNQIRAMGLDEAGLARRRFMKGCRRDRRRCDAGGTFAAGARRLADDLHVLGRLQ